MKPLQLSVLIVLFFSTGLCLAQPDPEPVSDPEPIVHHDPIAIGNPATGFVGASSVLPFDQANEFTSRAYDNFSLDDNYSISGLHWIGAFNNVFNPTFANPENEEEIFRGVVDFRVEVLADNNNRPNASSVLHTFELNGGLAGINDGQDVVEEIVPGQTHSSGGAVVSYQSELSPFVLEPGNYWLSIQARQTFPSPFPAQNPTDPNRHEDPSWSWVLSESDDKRIFSFDQSFGDVNEPGVALSTNDLAFTLLGEVFVPPEPSLKGDFDGNEMLEVADIDLLAAAIRGGSEEGQFDVNEDGALSDADIVFWVEELKGTIMGDVDLNKAVNFPDFLVLSQNFTKEGGWGQGNFNSDTLVNFPDFLLFSGNFAKVAPAASAVPEPSALCLILACLFGLVPLRRRR